MSIAVAVGDANGNSPAGSGDANGNPVKGRDSVPGSNRDGKANRHARTGSTAARPTATPELATPAAEHPYQDDFWSDAGVAEARAALDRGADIHTPDEVGMTPLHVAAAFNAEPCVVELLLDHGADIHQRSRRTLLRLKTNRLSHTQPASFPLAYDSAPYRNRPEQEPGRLRTRGACPHWFQGVP